MSDLFRTRDHVADFDAIVEDYRAMSAGTRARLRSVSGLRYGEGEEETLDLFLPERAEGAAPVHVFVHGGYWRMFGKEDFSFVAEPVVAAGGIAVVLDYALMPAVRLPRIVDQVRRALGWVAREIGRFGGDPRALSVSGHSAGAHLCLWLLDRQAPALPIRSALLLSGVYDLAPLRHSFLHPLIGLTEKEATRWSPLRADFQGTQAQVLLAVGERETAPFHAQGAEMAALLAAQGVASAFETLPDTDHMRIVRDLARPGSPSAEALRRTLAAAAPVSRST